MRYFRWVMFGIILVSHGVVSASFNSDYEDWLHNIYLEFYEQAVPAQRWDGIVTSKNKDNYKVKPGDNLSQISANVLGSATYWPKLWAVNSQLSNPHLIAENTHLSLKAGGGLRFSAAGKPARKQITAKFIRENKEGKKIKENKKVLLPALTSRIRPVLKKFPKSFPLWKSIYHQQQEKLTNELAIEFVEPAVSGQKLSVYLDNMIIERIPNSIGEVLPSGRRLLYSKGQDIFIKVFGDAVVDVGQRLRVVDTKPIYFKNQSIDERLLQVRAELKVIEVVAKTDEAFYAEYKAKITHSFLSIKEGDSIIYGPLRKFFVEKNTSNKTLPRLGLIMGGKGLSSPELLGLHNLVYLNVGLQDSLKVGDVFPVYQSLKSRGGRDRWGDTVAAYINILNVQKNTATAVISQIMSDIKVGDRVGSFDGVSDLKREESDKLDFEEFGDDEDILEESSFFEKKKTIGEAAQDKQLEGDLNGNELEDDLENDLENNESEEEEELDL